MRTKLKYTDHRILVCRRPKDGKPSLKVFGWKGKKATYTIRGPVTFVSVTCRIEGRPRKVPKKPKARRSLIRRLLRLGGKTV